MRQLVVVLVYHASLAVVAFLLSGDLIVKLMPRGVCVLFLFGVLLSIIRGRVEMRGMVAEASSDRKMFWCINAVCLVAAALLAPWSIGVVLGEARR